MNLDEQTRVTNSIAAAIEYIEKASTAALSRMVIRELRAAIALVSQAPLTDLHRAAGEINSLGTDEVELLASVSAARLARLRELDQQRLTPSDEGTAIGSATKT